MAGVSTPFLFPFCVPEVSSGEVGSGTEYPIGVSLDTAMKWYWRVKTWRITGDFEDDPSFPETATDTGTPLASESVLVCPQHAFADAQGDHFIIEAESPVYKHIVEFGMFTLGLSSPHGRMVRVGSTYYPNLWVVITNDYFDPTQTTEFVIAGNTSPDGAGQTTITIENYWPYDPGDGPMWDAGPIYDTSTGAQLRDPFSIQP